MIYSSKQVFICRVECSSRDPQFREKIVFTQLKLDRILDLFSLETLATRTRKWLHVFKFWRTSSSVQILCEQTLCIRSLNCVCYCLVKLVMNFCLVSSCPVCPLFTSFHVLLVYILTYLFIFFALGLCSSCLACQSWFLLGWRSY